MSGIEQCKERYLGYSCHKISSHGDEHHDVVMNFKWHDDTEGASP